MKPKILEVPPEYADLLFTVNEMQLNLNAIASFITTRAEATPVYDAWLKERLELISNRVAIAQREIE